MFATRKLHNFFSLRERKRDFNVKNKTSLDRIPWIDYTGSDRSAAS